MRRPFSELRPADQIRTVLWFVIVAFALSALVFAYVGIINDDVVFGRLAGLNAGVAVLLAFGTGISYLD